MEPFFVLLVLGAVVLIAITVVIVWPARPTLQVAEATASTMSQASIPPQGDRFEDQYTSATADLSAGGVAAALQHEPSAATGVEPPRSAEMRGLPTQEPTASTIRQPWPEADTRAEPIEVPARAESFRYPVPTRGSRTLMRPTPVTIGIGTGAALSLASAIVGAWLYARWQRKRQEPISRLQRTPAMRMTYALLGGSSVVVWRMLNRAPTEAKRRLR